MRFANQKGTTLLETIIAIAMLSAVVLVAFSFFSIFRASYIEQMANVQCQQNARTAENHILSNIRRCNQAKLATLPEISDTLTLFMPSNDGDIEATYSIETSGNISYLIFEKSGAKIEVAKYIDITQPNYDINKNNKGFYVENNDGVIIFTIKTKHQPITQRAATFQISASHRIRTD